VTTLDVPIHYAGEGVATDPGSPLSPSDPVIPLARIMDAETNAIKMHAASGTIFLKYCWKMCALLLGLFKDSLQGLRV
jgi:hypothetical protein